MASSPRKRARRVMVGLGKQLGNGGSERSMGSGSEIQSGHAMASLVLSCLWEFEFAQ